MALLGTAYLPMELEIADIASDSGLSSSLRTGLAIFGLAGHEDMPIRPEWGWASRSRATVLVPHGARLVNGVSSGPYSALYENLLLLPASVDIKTIAAPYEGDFVIWNSTFQTLTLTVNRVGWDGIEDNIGGNTLTLGPLCDRVIHYVVTLTGPSTVAASVTFFDNTRSVAFGISGHRGLVFPFRPDRGFRENWEWKTEIQSAWDFTEQRLALRDVPRVSCEFDYRLQSAEATQADLIFYNMAGYDFTLPRWEQQTTATVHAGDETIICDIAWANWQVGSSGIIWKSAREYELFTVAQVGAGSLRPEAPIAHEFGRALIMPCVGAKLYGDMTRIDGPMDTFSVQASFRLADPPDWELSDAQEQLDGHDVWKRPMYNEVPRTMTCPAVTLDNGLGIIREFHAQPTSMGGWQMIAYADGLAEITALRGMLLRRQGCVRPFWTSTRRHDFIPAATLRANSADLVVKGCSTGTSFPARSMRKRLCIELTDGTVLYRGILGLLKENTAFDTLTLSEPLDSENDISPADIARISFLTLVRLASDKVAWTWLRPDRAEVSFAVQEVLV